VVEAHRCEAKGLALSKARKQEIILLHHTMPRLLQPFVVRVPFIDSISLPRTNIATRRTFQQFRYAIAAIALLRQYQKQVQCNEETGEHYIEADETDYRVAHSLIANVLARKYAPLNQKSLDLLGIVQDHVAPDEEFTQKNLQDWTGASNTTVRRRLDSLVSCGVVAANTEKKPYKYKVVHADLAKAADLNLPTPDGNVAEGLQRSSENRTVDTETF